MALISETCMAKGTRVAGAKSRELRCGLKVKSYRLLLGKLTPDFSASCTSSAMVVSKRFLNVAPSRLVGKRAAGTKNFRVWSRNSASFFCSPFAFSIFSWFGYGSRATNCFHSSVRVFSSAVTSSTACFRVRRKKIAKPSRPRAIAPPPTRNKLRFTQFISKLHRMFKLQRDAEAESNGRFIHRLDISGKFGFLPVEQGTFLEFFFDGVGEVVIGGGGILFQIQATAFDGHHRDFVRGSRRGLGRSRCRGRFAAFGWRRGSGRNHVIPFHHEFVIECLLRGVVDLFLLRFLFRRRRQTGSLRRKAFDPATVFDSRHGLLPVCFRLHEQAPKLGQDIRPEQALFHPFGQLVGFPVQFL